MKNVLSNIRNLTVSEFLIGFMVILLGGLLVLMHTDVVNFGRVNGPMSSTLGARYIPIFENLGATTAEYGCGGGGGSCTVTVTASDGKAYTIDTNTEAWKQFDFYASFDFKAALIQTPRGPTFQVRESSHHSKRSFGEIATQISSTLNRILASYTAESARQHAIDTSWRQP
jgi:hypothetical protein